MCSLYTVVLRHSKIKWVASDERSTIKLEMQLDPVQGKLSDAELLR